MHACLSGQFGCTELLLEAGANAVCKNNLSQTPLMMAAKSGSEECVKLLLENKPDLQVRYFPEHRGKNNCVKQWPAQIIYTINYAQSVTTIH